MDTNLPTLTRRGVLALAKEELGLPLSKAKLDKLCMDRKGPPPLGMFSGKHIYAQVIDDDAGRTLAAASTMEHQLHDKGKAAANRAAAEQIGKTIAERLLAKKLDRVVFDRGGFFYHGKVRALADAARAGGLKF